MILSRIQIRFSALALYALVFALSPVSATDDSTPQVALPSLPVSAPAASSQPSRPTPGIVPETSAPLPGTADPAGQNPETFFLIQPYSPVEAFYEARALTAVSTPSLVVVEPLVRPASVRAPRIGLPAVGDRIVLLAQIAFRGGSGLLRREAGILWVSRLAAIRQAEACRAAAAEVLAAEGQDKDLVRAIRRSLLDLETATGDDASILAAVGDYERALKIFDINTLASEADFIAWTSLYARYRSGDPTWIGAATALLRTRPAGPWMQKLFELLAQEEIPGPTGIEDRALATMRAAIGRRDYGAAWNALKPILPALLKPETSSLLISEAGRACLSAPQPASLLPLWEALEKDSAALAARQKAASSQTPAYQRQAWLAGFYRARILAATGSAPEATALYWSLATRAPAASDLDSALWYWLDATIKDARRPPQAAGTVTAAPAISMAASTKGRDSTGSAASQGSGSNPSSAALAAGTRAASVATAPPAAAAPDGSRSADAGAVQRAAILEAFIAASTLWKNPAYYEDLLEPFLRETIIAKDSTTLRSMATKLAPALSATSGARVGYAAARMFELEAENLLQLVAAAEAAAKAAPAQAPEPSPVPEAGSSLGSIDSPAKEISLDQSRTVSAPATTIETPLPRIGSPGPQTTVQSTGEAAEARSEAPTGPRILGHDRDDAGQPPEPSAAQDEATAALESPARGLNAEAAILFRRVADTRSAPLYYRALSAWRSGLDLDFLPDTLGAQIKAADPATLRSPPGGAGPGTADAAWPADPSETSSDIEASEDARSAPPLSEAARYVFGFILRGLGPQAGDEAMAKRGSMSTEELAWLASRLRDAGEADEALVLADVVVKRRGEAAGLEDYQNLYPRPWIKLLTTFMAGSTVPQEVFYGLLRSESLFDPEAVSRSGAIGLAQLMPPTAAETARRLKMPWYNITDPADNLYIGFTYYRSMVRSNDNRLAQGMFAYNAGPGRLSRWLAALPPLPDDLLLEVLEASETRQYGRSITQAALHYAALYAGKGTLETVGSIFGPPGSLSTGNGQRMTEK